MMYHLLWFLLAFPLGRVFPAPIPQSPTATSASIVPKPGDFVGVRPGAYEEKTKENVGRSSHQAISSF
jgi:hypothetical protein